MKLKNKLFNGIEYTLVDFYNWNEKEIIIHFAGDESDVFCRYIANQYILIEDETTIKNILEYYLLKPSEFAYSRVMDSINAPKGIGDIKEITPELKQKFIKEQLDKLGELKNGVDLNVLSNRLNNVKYYIADKWEYWAGASCQPARNTIFLQRENVKKDDNISKRLRLHETIHALAGKAYWILNYNSYINKSGLIEGATENVVEKLYGFKTSTFGKEGKIRFNFSKNTSYQYQVSLIRQMEAALGKECNESILTGNNEFYNEFAEKYGKDTLRFLRHRTNRLLNPYKIEDEIEYFKETQNTVLQKVFDKDFADIETVENAKEYLKKLQSFELTRGKIEGDTFFKEYYEEKFEAVKVKLNLKGENIGKLSNFEYKESEFYPITTKEEMNQHMLDIASEEIPKYIEKGKDISNELRNFKFYTAKQGSIDRLLITINDNPIYMEYGDNKTGWGASTLDDENSYLNRIEKIDETFKMDIGDKKYVDFQEFALENMQELEERVDKLVNGREGITIEEKTSFLQKINPINQIRELYQKISAIIKNRNIKQLPPGKDIEKVTEKEESFNDKRKEMLTELTKCAPTLEEQKQDSIKRSEQQKDNMRTKIQIDREYNE